METLQFALRDEIVNIFALTYGHLPLQYRNQIVLCKKNVFTQRYQGPFLLVPKVSKGSFTPSEIGTRYLERILPLEYEYKFVAYLDSYIRIPIVTAIFKTLTNDGFFSIWPPSEPLRYFEGLTQGYLAILRVFELTDEISPACLSRGIRGRNFYFRLDEPANVMIKAPVIDDETFIKMKSSLVKSLQATGLSISLADPLGNEM